MANSKSQKEIISQLKQKLHQSFIHISDVQRIYEGQLENQKQNYEKQIKDLQTINQNLLNKVKEMEKNTNGKSFFIDGFGSDYSVLEIDTKQFSESFWREQSLTDLIQKGQFNSQFQCLTEIQNNIKKLAQGQIIESLNEYVKIVKELYDENIRMKDQIQILKNSLQIQNDKIIYFSSSYQKTTKQNQNLRNIESQLKDDNSRLAEMYHELLLKTQTLSKKLADSIKDKPIAEEKYYKLNFGQKDIGKVNNLKDSIQKTKHQTSNSRTTNSNNSNNGNVLTQQAHQPSSSPLRQSLRRFPFKKLLSMNNN